MLAVFRTVPPKQINVTLLSVIRRDELFIPHRFSQERLSLSSFSLYCWWFSRDASHFIGGFSLKYFWLKSSVPIPNFQLEPSSLYKVQTESRTDTSSEWLLEKLPPYSKMGSCRSQASCQLDVLSGSASGCTSTGRLGAVSCCWGEHLLAQLSWTNKWMNGLSRRSEEIKNRPHCTYV